MRKLRKLWSRRHYPSKYCKSTTHTTRSTSINFSPKTALRRRELGTISPTNRSKSIIYRGNWSGRPTSVTSRLTTGSKPPSTPSASTTLILYKEMHSETRQMRPKDCSNSRSCKKLSRGEIIFRWKRGREREMPRKSSWSRRWLSWENSKGDQLQFK